MGGSAFTPQSPPIVALIDYVSEAPWPGRAHRIGAFMPESPYSIGLASFYARRGRSDDVLVYATEPVRPND